MILSYALLAAINLSTLPPTIEFIDSKDDDKITYLFITKPNEKPCAVRINKAELKDYDRAIAVAMERCGL